MNSIPIFDSLTHPTINSDWILPRYQKRAKISELQKEMDENNVQWAFAVGMKNIGGYNEEEYISFINSKTDRLYPIAYYDPGDYLTKDESKNHLLHLKRIGYKGIKLHPRYSNFSLNANIAYIIKTANDLHLLPLLCSYSYSKNNARFINPDSLMDFLVLLEDAKVVLLHAGAVRLLEYMEIARTFNNVLLDLSLTLCKYEGSSIDYDISYLFKSFDRRICIGSDFPEYSLCNLRERFDFFSKELSIMKKENIAHRNLLNFLNERNPIQ